MSTTEPRREGAGFGTLTGSSPALGLAAWSRVYQPLTIVKLSFWGADC
jgi:hypothetical protein